MTDEHWRQILRIMDEAYADFLSGMAALGKRVVGDVKRKVSDRTVPDHPRGGARSVSEAGSFPCRRR